MYKAVVVDDHPFIRATVCMLLRQDRVEVLGQADNGIDALRLALTRQSPSFTDLIDTP